MKRKIIKTSVVVFLLIVMVFSGYNAVNTYLDLKDADNTYEELQNKYVQIMTESVPHDQTVPKNSEDEDTEETENPTQDSDQTDTSDTPDIQPDDPQPNPITVRVDFDSLLADNGDVVGWIYCEDTPINYPVVQAEDNNKYLRADLNGEYLVSGTIFADYRNGGIGENANYIIYGHNMKSQIMFGTLVNYKKQSYYDAHPVIQYLTPECNYIIELVAGVVADRTDIIYQPDPKEQELQEYLKSALQKSTFDSGLSFNEGDVLVTLSTCSDEFENARYILIGRMIPVNN